MPKAVKIAIKFNTPEEVEKYLSRRGLSSAYRPGSMALINFYGQTIDFQTLEVWLNPRFLDKPYSRKDTGYFRRIIADPLDTMLRQLEKAHLGVSTAFSDGTGYVTFSHPIEPFKALNERHLAALQKLAPSKLKEDIIPLRQFLHSETHQRNLRLYKDVRQEVPNILVLPETLTKKLQKEEAKLEVIEKEFNTVSNKFYTQRNKVDKLLQQADKFKKTKEQALYKEVVHNINDQNVLGL